MAESIIEENAANQKLLPSVTVGVLIKNKDGKCLLIRNPHWNNRLVIVGGHVEYGESLEEAVRREVREEVGIEIDHLDLIGTYELINDPEYLPGGHVVSFRFCANLDKTHGEIALDMEEAVEYEWLTLEEIMARDEVVSTVKAFVQDVLDKTPPKEKKSFFSHRCHNCEKNEKEMEEYKLGWQRALADYKNLQKEISDRRAEWAKMSELQIIEEFIPVYDNFKTAFGMERGSEDGGYAGWVKGIEYIMKQFGDVLKSHGIEEIKTVGEKFDIKLHDAAGEEDSDLESGTIIREITSGYRLGERVVRAARVIVAK